MVEKEEKKNIEENIEEENIEEGRRCDVDKTSTICTEFTSRGKPICGKRRV